MTVVARAPRSHRLTLPKPGHVATHLLPPMLRRLIQALGEVAAYRLCEHYGGVPLCIPKRVLPAHTEHPVFLLIGPEAFAALVAEWGTEVLLVPKTDSLLRQVRHRRVRDLAHDARMLGRPLSAVALESGYSIRQVHNILAGEDCDDVGQLDLFAAPVDTTEARDNAPETPVPTAHNPFGIRIARDPEGGTPLDTP